MNTILCPVDFSKNAEKAALYAAELAKISKADIKLMHIYTAPVVHTEVPFTGDIYSLESIIQSAEKNLAKLKNKIQKITPRTKITHQLLTGIASEEITGYAKKIKAGYIVIGATGAGAIEQTIIGSHTTKVMNSAPCNVLVIPPKASFKGIKKIICATDLDEKSLKLFKPVSELAKINRSELMFVYVNDKLFPDNENDIQRMVKQIKKHISYSKMSGYISRETNVVEGLEFFVKKHKADLLCMVKQQQRFPASLFHKSVTKKMSYHTRIPLLIIPSAIR